MSTPMSSMMVNRAMMSELLIMKMLNLLFSFSSLRIWMTSSLKRLPVRCSRKFRRRSEV